MSNFVRFKAKFDQAVPDAVALSAIDQLETVMAHSNLFNAVEMNWTPIHKEAVMNAYYEFQSDVLVPLIVDVAGSGPVDLDYYDDDDNRILFSVKDLEEAIAFEHDPGYDGYGPLYFSPEFEGTFEAFQSSPQFYESYQVTFDIYDPRVAVMLKLQGYEQVPIVLKMPKNIDLSKY